MASLPNSKRSSTRASPIADPASVRSGPRPANRGYAPRDAAPPGSAPSSDRIARPTTCRAAACSGRVMSRLSANVQVAPPRSTQPTHQPTSGVDFHAPFGGEKQSSFGPREQGKAARELYTTTHTITIGPAGS